MELVTRDYKQVQNTNNLDAVTFEKFIAFIDASEKTVTTYKKNIRQFMKYLYTNGIKNPTRETVLAYKDTLVKEGYKPSTIQSYLVAVRLFFKWTYQEGIYPNISEHIKSVKVDKSHKKDYLTAQQIKTILSGIDTSTIKGMRDYAVFSLMVTCGLRTIEVSRATIEDIRTAGNDTVLYIQGKGKTGKDDFVKLSPKVESILRAYIKTRKPGSDKEPLFTSTSNNSNGKAMTTRSISGLIKEILVNAGYDSERLTAHSLRHTAVTLSLLAGKDITEVQQFARHSNVTTTMIYNHALDKAKNTCSNAVTDAIF